MALKQRLNKTNMRMLRLLISGQITDNYEFMALRQLFLTRVIQESNVNMVMQKLVNKYKSEGIDLMRNLTTSPQLHSAKKRMVLETDVAMPNAFKTVG